MSLTMSLSKSLTMTKVSRVLSISTFLDVKLCRFSCFLSHGHYLFTISPPSIHEFLEINEMKNRRNVSFRVSSHLHHSRKASNLFLLHIQHSSSHHNHYHFSILLFPVLLTLESVFVPLHPSQTNVSLGELQRLLQVSK